MDKQLNLNKKLFDAIKNGDFKKFKELVSEDSDISARDVALSVAAFEGHLDLVEYLVEELGANVNALDFDGSPPLHCIEDLDVINYLVENGADVHIRDDEGYSTIKYAVLSSNIDVIRCLVKNGANIKEKDEDEDSLLHTAACCGHVEVVKCLVEEYCLEIEDLNFDGQTPLDLAREKEQEEVIEYLESKMNNE